jgi:hypothetical protein
MAAALQLRDPQYVNQKDASNDQWRCNNPDQWVRTAASSVITAAESGLYTVNQISGLAAHLEVQCRKSTWLRTWRTKRSGRTKFWLRN